MSEIQTGKHEVKDDDDIPFEEEEDTTTPRQRLHYFGLCWLIANHKRPKSAIEMRRRIHELNDEYGPRRRLPRETWEQAIIRKLTKLLEELKQQ